MAFTSPSGTPASDGSPGGWGIDGPAYGSVVRMAHGAPGWFDATVAVWTAYGLAVFAALFALGWWRARRRGPAHVVTALCVPVAVLAAYAVNDAVKLLVREDRPCRHLHLATVEACPPHGDWSFPSNHAALAVSAAVALWFVSRRLGAMALVAAVAMAASRVWVGVHYPHDVLAGAVVGALVALLLASLTHRHSEALAHLLGKGRQRVRAGARDRAGARAPRETA
ncbi:phosphatase PAP2 family protein [Streptomyces sp. ODS28]|uniref:phosphatase PAP2 family protein n=1 Tax=Streptomyces sp. ODS28 TaxID=3136688 RepID=UPI0031E7ACC0